MKRLLWMVCFMMLVCGMALADEGLIKPDGTVILPPIYHSIQRDDDGHFRIEKDGCVGWADRDGKIIVPPVWDFVSFFSEGLGLVAHDGLFGYVDEQGNTVIEPQWPLAFSFYHGYAMIAYPLDENGNIEQSFAATSTWAYYTDERTADEDYFALDTWEDDLLIADLIGGEDYYALGVIDRSGNVIVAPTTQNLEALVKQYARLERRPWKKPPDHTPASKDWFSYQNAYVINEYDNYQQLLDSQGTILSDHLKDEQGNNLSSIWSYIKPALTEGQFIGYVEFKDPAAIELNMYRADNYLVYLIQPTEGIGRLLPYRWLEIDTDRNCYIGYAKLGADLLNSNAQAVYTLPFGIFDSYDDELYLIDNSLPLSAFNNTEVFTLSKTQILELCGTPTLQDTEPTTGYERYWYGDSYFVFDATTLMRFGTTYSYPIKPNVLTLFEQMEVHRYESFGVVYLAIVTPDRVLLQENNLSQEASELLKEDKSRFAERYFPGYPPDSIVTFYGYFSDLAYPLLDLDSDYDSDGLQWYLNYALFYEGLCDGRYRYELCGDAWGVDGTYSPPSDINWVETLACRGCRFDWDVHVDKP